jgi:acyl-homoserine lactone acylase PvdQ
MRIPVLFLLCASIACGTPGGGNPDLSRWQAQADRVTIIRDDWGIPHVYGKTDADAVFGVIYAQAEDDFNRVETNFLNSQGRLAEAEGESQIYRDLRMKLFIDPADMKAQYDKSPDWLKALMNAWADGLNFYLHTHPEVTPRVITRFEPWMALTFSEGSIGGDIERVNLTQLQAFYGKAPRTLTSTTPAAPAGLATRLQWHRGCAFEQREREGTPPHQPPHVVLLQGRGADGQRGRPQRLRRPYLGPVLHLPGLQRSDGMDAHVERRGQHRRVSGDGRSEG